MRTDLLSHKCSPSLAYTNHVSKEQIQAEKAYHLFQTDLTLDLPEKIGLQTKSPLKPTTSLILLLFDLATSGVNLSLSLWNPGKQGMLECRMGHGIWSLGAVLEGSSV